MHDPAAAPAPNRRLSLKVLTRIRGNLPTLAEVSLATGSALLLVLSFPNFELWWLAWVGLVPLLVVIARAPSTGRAFILGLTWGTIFFYGSCWWLTYSMIHYGQLPSWLAYPLLVPVIVLVAIFPALGCAVLARLITRFGTKAVFAAPILWIAFDWLRYSLTGQLWNSLGYSQAFHPALIVSSRWGGVYAVTFLLVATSSSIAFVLIQKAKGVKFTVAGLAFVILVQTASTLALVWSVEVQSEPPPNVVAVQPNVPMDSPSDAASEKVLLIRHLELSLRGLRDIQNRESAVLVIWPESPMSFRYSRDPDLQNLIGSFARAEHTSVMLNSLEPAPNGGAHNSAIMINEEGRIVAQYDKIRLMPFGEYVPLPRWLPGASSVRGLVGEFVPGSSYTLMPLGAIRAGAFICIEASHPGIAREYAKGGADVLINISNDGYLGPTPVMRQHLSNAIFRAVENDRPLIRVTNNGISAFIGPAGNIVGPTPGYEPAVRTWPAGNRTTHKTFYTQNGDVFAYVCLVMTFGFLAASFLGTRNRKNGS